MSTEARILGEGGNEELPSPIFWGISYGPHFFPQTPCLHARPHEASASPSPYTQWTSPANCSGTLPTPPGQALISPHLGQCNGTTAPASLRCDKTGLPKAQG